MNRLKNHETPRKSGVRNKKGKGGSAKKRQYDKKIKNLRNKLKE